jgi:hypothetical protein
MRHRATINAKVRSLALWCVVTGLAILAVLVSVLSWHYGSLSLAMARLRGERFVLSPAEVDFGVCEPNTEHTAKLTLTNLTVRPVRVVGSEASCTCETIGELPIVVAPGQSREIALRAVVSKSASYSQQMLLYIDDGTLRTIAVQIRAGVRQHQPSAGARAMREPLGRVSVDERLFPHRGFEASWRGRGLTFLGPERHPWRSGTVPAPLRRPQNAAEGIALRGFRPWEFRSADL